mmetsp:Transcript_52708/g.60307  ORF Transcript_52708/g.60307 Transcript_52708/m.60307 type:complete len:123 (-) Transcript_52708:287-655(-)
MPLVYEKNRRESVLSGIAPITTLPPLQKFPAGVKIKTKEEENTLILDTHTHTQWIKSDHSDGSSNHQQPCNSRLLNVILERYDWMDFSPCVCVCVCAQELGVRGSAFLEETAWLPRVKAVLF